MTNLRRVKVQRSRASVEKSNKALQATLTDLMKKVEEAKYAISDVENVKRKTAIENADFLRCVGELDNSLSILLKLKNDLAAQLSEAKSIADNEARERQLLVGKFKNYEHEFEGARGVLDEETSALDNLCRSVTKAEGEAQVNLGTIDQTFVTCSASDLETQVRDGRRGTGRGARDGKDEAPSKAIR